METDQSRLCDKASIKNPRSTEFIELSGCWTHGGDKRVAHGDGMEALYSFLIHLDGRLYLHHILS